jgi:hypothetical protein
VQAGVPRACPRRLRIAWAPGACVRWCLGSCPRRRKVNGDTAGRWQMRSGEGGLRCRCYRAGEGGDTARYGRARSVPRPNTLHCGGAALGRLLRHMRSRLQYHSRYRWGSRGAGVLALAPLPRRSIAASPAGPTTTALPGVGPRGGDRRGLLVSPLSWRDEIRQLVRLGRIGAAGSTGIWPRMQVM